MTNWEERESKAYHDKKKKKKGVFTSVSSTSIPSMNKIFVTEVPKLHFKNMKNYVEENKVLQKLSWINEWWFNNE